MPTYADLLKQQTALYKKIGKVYCPVLKEDIVFNSKGFQHIKYDGLGHGRTIKERMYRLYLVPHIEEVIKNATKIHQYRARAYSKKLGKYVEFWELKEKVGKPKITVKVVLRRIGTGNITFWSVMKIQSKIKKPSPKR